MVISYCPKCESKNIALGRYLGTSFWVLAMLTLGSYLLALPFMPLQIRCRHCGTKAIYHVV
ncbi:MAG: hypothetical protein HYU86_04055 [Chloroflexi bacterium]|nr:hypothetical protein [Chloroflexota bacterium]